jgi:TPR repeat protein
VECFTQESICEGARVEILLNEIRCGKRESWNTLFSCGINEGSKFAMAALALCCGDRDLLLNVTCTEVGKQFGRCMLPWLKDRCEKLNCKYALYLIGEYYLHGIAVKRSDVNAFKLFALSADQGCASSLYRVGMCLETGTGILLDEISAAEYYHQAADKLHPCAINNLGMCYLSGFGVPVDPAKAMRYLKVAADLGLAAAQNNVGTSLDLEEKYELALQYFQQAADQGLAEAQANLAYYYSDGLAGLPVEPTEAIRLWKLAAERGHSVALYELGMALHTKRDATALLQPLSLIQESARQGFSEAQCTLGFWYEKGIHVSVNLEEAVELYRLAAAQGLGLACYRLAKCYQNGSGTPKDYVEAVRLFNLASIEGIIEADEELSKLNGFNWC